MALKSIVLISSLKHLLSIRRDLTNSLVASLHECREVHVKHLASATCGLFRLPEAQYRSLLQQHIKPEDVSHWCHTSEVDTNNTGHGGLRVKCNASFLNTMIFSMQLLWLGMQAYFSKGVRS